MACSHHDEIKQRTLTHPPVVHQVDPIYHGPDALSPHGSISYGTTVLRCRACGAQRCSACDWTEQGQSDAEVQAWWDAEVAKQKGQNGQGQVRGAVTRSPVSPAGVGAVRT